MLSKIVFFVLIALIHIKQLPAQSLKSDGFFTAIIVDQIDTSIAWYSNLLGCKLVDHVQLEERGLRQGNLQCGNFQLELIQITSSISSTEVLAITSAKRLEGFFKIGFIIDDFEYWIKRANDLEVSFNGDIVKQKDSHKRMAVLLDPDGNRVQLFEK